MHIEPFEGEAAPHELERFDGLHKLASVVQRRDGTIRFLAIGMGVPVTYGTDAEAECFSHRDHAAPEPDCRCGFNAAFTDTWLAAHADVHDTRAVWLVVDVYGKLIEYSEGVRAQSQVVLEARFPDTCARCGDPAAGFRVDTADTGLVEPACAHHSELSVADLRGHLGCGVSFHDRSHLPSRPSVAETMGSLPLALGLLATTMMFLGMLAAFGYGAVPSDTPRPFAVVGADPADDTITVLSRGGMYMGADTAQVDAAERDDAGHVMLYPGLSATKTGFGTHSILGGIATPGILVAGTLAVGLGMLVTMRVLLARMMARNGHRPSRARPGRRWRRR